MRKLKYFLCLILLTISTSTWADFTGHDLIAQYYFPNLATPHGASQTATVGPGVEFTNFPNLDPRTNIDVSATNITINYLSADTWSQATHNGPVFTDMNGTIPPIIGVTVNGATNMAGFSAANVAFTADTITINWQGLSFTTATVVSLDVQFGAVAYTIGGNVTGLAPGNNSVVLQNNLGDDLTVNANGAFTFATALADLSNYAVTVLTQPTAPNQTCVVTSGSGTLAGANVTNVAVDCTTNTYTVGGNVSGLAPGNSVVLQNNGGG